MDTSEFKTFEQVVAAEWFVFTMTAEDETNPWLCAISDLWDLLQPSKWLEYGLWNFASVAVPGSEIEDIEALVLSMMAAIWIRFAPRYLWSAKHHAASAANPSKSSGAREAAWEKLIALEQYCHDCIDSECFLIPLIR